MRIIERRKIFYILSLLLIIPGLISLCVQGLNLGIDFTGGSILQVKMDSAVKAIEVRETINKIDIGGADVTKSGDNEFFIRTKELDQKQTNELMDVLRSQFNDVEFLSAESVGATIGNELTRNAFSSLLIAAVLMLIYITIRFEWSFGVTAIIAIIHDMLLVLGIFSLFQWEVNSAFIAAVLTIVGYSINDTIVIFDRIRENLRMKRKEEYITLLNRSIMQTLTRCINTVLTTICPLITLLLFGGSTIKLFVLTMLIGFISGAYSSIFVASPLLLEIESRK